MRSGLPHLRFHDLRHAHATLLLCQGVHPKVVSERLGHATRTRTRVLVYSGTDLTTRSTVPRLTWAAARTSVPLGTSTW
jgi:integrase